MLANGFKNTDNNATTKTITKTATAAMTGSMMGGTFDASQVPSKVASAINQLSANQTTLSQQMAEMLFNAPLPISPPFNVQPMQALAMPGIPRGLPSFIGGSYNQGGFNQGSGFDQRRGGHSDGHWGRVRGYGWGAVAALPSRI